MVKRIFLAIAVLGMTLGVVGLAPQMVAADSKQDVLNGVNAAGNQDGPSLNSIITNVVNIMSMIVGILAVIMIIYAGFRYVSSGGDSSGISGAKNTLIYAIVGLIVVAMAQFIVQFVLKKVAH